MNDLWTGVAPIALTAITGFGAVQEGKCKYFSSFLMSRYWFFSRFFFRSFLYPLIFLPSFLHLDSKQILRLLLEIFMDLLTLQILLPISSTLTILQLERLLLELLLLEQVLLIVVLPWLLECKFLKFNVFLSA